jgi:hypothetical protein
VFLFSLQIKSGHPHSPFAPPLPLEKIPVNPRRLAVFRHVTVLRQVLPLDFIDARRKSLDPKE